MFFARHSEAFACLLNTILFKLNIYYISSKWNKLSERGWSFCNFSSLTWMLLLFRNTKFYLFWHNVNPLLLFNSRRACSYLGAVFIYLLDALMGLSVFAGFCVFVLVWAPLEEHLLRSGSEPDSLLHLFALLCFCQTLSRLWPASRPCKETFGPDLSANAWKCLCTCTVAAWWEFIDFEGIPRHMNVIIWHASESELLMQCILMHP